MGSRSRGGRQRCSIGLSNPRVGVQTCFVRRGLGDVAGGEGEGVDRLRRAEGGVTWFGDGVESWRAGRGVALLRNIIG